MSATYLVVKHPAGEYYAAEVDAAGRILRAAGPLHHSDPRDADALRDMIANQSAEDAEGDGEWLDEALMPAR